MAATSFVSRPGSACAATTLAAGIPRQLAFPIAVVCLLGLLVGAGVIGSERSLRVFALHFLPFALLGLHVVRVHWSREDTRRTLTTGVTLPVTLLVAWAAASFFTSAPDAGVPRAIALAELVRLLSGAALYLVAMRAWRTRRQQRAGMYLLVAGAAIVSVAGIISTSASEMRYASAAFGEKQLLGAFLGTLLPVAATLAVSAATGTLRKTLWVCAAALLTGLLLTGNRSSWAGATVGMIVVAGASLRQQARCGGMRRPRIPVRGVVLTACFLTSGLALFPQSGIGALVTQRLSRLSFDDPAVQWRLRVWAAGAEMIRHQPVAGTGIGSFPLVAGRYALSPQDLPQSFEVEKRGVTLHSLAHSEYVQTAVELGLIGLTLYLAVLGSFFALVARALGRGGLNRTRRMVLTATLGAVAAQSVDALANPAWRFGDVSPLLWILLGVGAAAAGSAPQRPRPAANSAGRASASARKCIAASTARWYVLPCGAAAVIFVAGWVGAGHAAANGPAAHYIRVDADRDPGRVISFTDASDDTSATRPYRFWLNDDDDGVSEEGGDQEDLYPAPHDMDFLDEQIDCTRDLEDFARIHVRTPSGFAPKDPQWKCTLRFMGVSRGTPVVRVWRATSGSTGYLFDESTAVEQRAVTENVWVEPGGESTLPAAFFASPAAAYLLFECVYEGAGALTVRFYKGATKVAEDRVFLDLRRITAFYDHYTVGDTTRMDVDQIPQIPEVVHQAQFPADKPTYILFVHGWRLMEWERRWFAETAYKRLWHQGYKGAFGLFSWPTQWNSGTELGSVADRHGFDMSEWKAWRSAAGLRSLLGSLERTYAGGVRMFAHSTGGIVAAEALRQEAESRRPRRLVHTYVATQTIPSADSFDATVPAIYEPDEPNIYAHFPPTGRPYFSDLRRAAGRLVNFFNRSDYALGDSVWEVDQWFKPNVDYFDVEYGYSERSKKFYRQRFNWGLGRKEYFNLKKSEDRYEAFAMAAPAWSKATGAQANVGGPFDVGAQRDLNAGPFFFGAGRLGHSAQFLSTNWRRQDYWRVLLDTFQLP